MTLNEDHNWKFAQCFGDKGDSDDITEGSFSISVLKRHANFTHNNSTHGTCTHFFFLSLFTLAADIISTVEFDHTGDYLATGDKGGRVVLFERSDSVRVNSSGVFHSKDN